MPPRPSMISSTPHRLSYRPARQGTRRFRRSAAVVALAEPVKMCASLPVVEREHFRVESAQGCPCCLGDCLVSDADPVVVGEVGCSLAVVREHVALAESREFLGGNGI